MMYINADRALWYHYLSGAAANKYKLFNPQAWVPLAGLELTTFCATREHSTLSPIGISHLASQVETRLLGRPQPQMYPPVALNQYTWVNRTHKHFLYMVQGPIQILK